MNFKFSFTKIDMINNIFPDEFDLDSLSESKFMSLKDFIHHRTKILEDKLGVLLFEMKEGLKLKDKIQSDLNDEIFKVGEKIHDLSSKANYNFSKLKEKGLFEEKIFELNREKREREIESWRNNVSIMRDFLEVWDEYEQARAKGRVLNNDRKQVNEFM